MEKWGNYKKIINNKNNFSLGEGSLNIRCFKRGIVIESFFSENGCSKIYIFGGGTVKKTFFQVKLFYV